MFLGIWVWVTLSPTPLEASFLTQPEREYVHQRVKAHKVCAAKAQLGSAGVLGTSHDCAASKCSTSASSEQCGQAAVKEVS